MSDLSNAEISVEGEYGECTVCGETFHWENLTNTAAGSLCELHASPYDDKEDPDESDFLYESQRDVEAGEGHRHDEGDQR